MPHFHDVDIQNAVVSVTEEVFDTMLAMPITYLPSFEQTYLYGSRIMSSVHLVGSVMGIVNIQVPTPLADKMTRSILGLDGSPGATQIGDTLSEICNMIGGNLKSSLCDAGLSCDMSVPVLTRGKDFRSSTRDMAFHGYYSFFCGNDAVLIDVALKRNEPSHDDVSAPAHDEPAQDNDDRSALQAFEIPGSIHSAVAAVFDTMLSTTAALASPSETLIESRSRMVCAISLSGKVLGRLYLDLPVELAVLLGADLLGMAPEDMEATDEITDAIGEITNMIGGTLKSDLCDAGLTCSMSPPSVTAGNDFDIDIPHLTRMETRLYQCAGHRLVVGVGLKPAGD